MNSLVNSSKLNTSSLRGGCTNLSLCTLDKKPKRREDTTQILGRNNYGNWILRLLSRSASTIQVVQLGINCTRAYLKWNATIQRWGVKFSINSAVLLQTYKADNYAISAAIICCQHCWCRPCQIQSNVKVKRRVQNESVGKKLDQQFCANTKILWPVLNSTRQEMDWQCTDNSGIHCKFRLCQLTQELDISRQAVAADWWM